MKTLKLTENTKKLIDEYLAAMASRDLEGIACKFSDKVDWFIAGNETIAPWLGRRNSRQEIKEFFQMLWANIESVSVTVEHILVDGNFGVVTGEFASRMLRTGKVYESVFSMHLTVQDNLIVRYRLQEDSYALVKALENN